MGRPGRAGRGVRLGGSGWVGGARLNARPEEESVRNGFQHSHIMQPLPCGPEAVPTVQCSVGARPAGVGTQGRGGAC